MQLFKPMYNIPKHNLLQRLCIHVSYIIEMSMSSHLASTPMPYDGPKSQVASCLWKPGEGT